MNADADAEISLQHGRWRVAVLPALGGAIARCEVESEGRWWSVLRPTPPGARDALQTACFPMVPFCGRIRDGRFGFRGREVHLPPMPPASTPLHGFVWRAPWRVCARTPARLELECSHPAGDWPWPFTATQILALDAEGLSLTLCARNTGEEAMPCGLGLHPYFPCDRDTRFSAHVTTRVQLDAQLLPIGRTALPHAATLQSYAVDGRGLDESFEGWDGLARIEHAGGHPGVRLSTQPALTRLHLYAPRDPAYFCAEPISHEIDAVNRYGSAFETSGLSVLAPGEQVTLQLRIGLP